MYKLFLVAAVVSMVAARPQHGHELDYHHGHGHAVSYQSIELHKIHDPKHKPVHHGEHQEKHHHGHHQEHHYGHHEEHHHGHYDEHHHGHRGHASSPQSIKHHGVATEKNDEYHAHPKYQFSYKVVDPHTGDKKSQHDVRDGHVEKGVYSLHQPDGTVRIVEYHGDKKTGFNANVKYEGHIVHIVPDHHHYH